MKKIGAIIASFALAFSLAGCSNSETSSVGNFAPSLIEDNSNADSSVRNIFRKRSRRTEQATKHSSARTASVNGDNDNRRRYRA